MCAMGLAIGGACVCLIKGTVLSCGRQRRERIAAPPPGHPAHPEPSPSLCNAGSEACGAAADECVMRLSSLLSPPALRVLSVSILWARSAVAGSLCNSVGVRMFVWPACATRLCGWWPSMKVAVIYAHAASRSEGSIRTP